MKLIPKPAPSEYPAYADMYIKLLPDDGLVLQHLQENFTAIKDFIYALPQDKLLHRYAPGKWSIKEILVHIVDDECIFSYRALRFARNEQQNMIGLTRTLIPFMPKLMNETWIIFLQSTKRCARPLLRCLMAYRRYPF